MKINLSNVKKIHFIGIGGISMSSLALICLSQNKIVSGSDKQTSNLLKNLKQKGITVYFKHSQNNITKNIDLVVFTSAIKSDNIELITAKQKNIPALL